MIAAPVKQRFLIAGLPFAIFLISIGLALSPLVNNHPLLVLGITCDLTLTAPLVYLLLIRNTNFPKITAVPLFILGIVIAHFVVPREQDGALQLIKTFLLPLVELAVLLLIIIKLKKAMKLGRAQLRYQPDVYDALKSVALQILRKEKLAGIVATELAMLYYALLSWKSRLPLPGSFTSFKESTNRVYLIAILLVLITETFGIHFLVSLLSSTLAWILTIASVYFCVQLLGHIKSMSRRHTEISGQQLHLRYGLFADLTVELSQITGAELSRNKSYNGELKTEQLLLLKNIETYNVALQFASPQKIELPYGFSKTCDVVLVDIDKPEQFLAELSYKISAAGSLPSAGRSFR